MVAPFIPLSLIRVFDPAPIIVNFKLKFLQILRNFLSSDSFFGLKKTSAGPPKLNQLYLDNFSLSKNIIGKFSF